MTQNVTLEMVYNKLSCLENKVSSLEKRLVPEVKITQREAAELAYVLAVIHKKEGNIKDARKYARQSIELFEGLDIQTLDDAASLYTVLNGIALPDLIHEGVVRDRLSDLFL